MASKRPSDPQPSLKQEAPAPSPVEIAEAEAREKSLALYTRQRQEHGIAIDIQRAQIIALFDCLAGITHSWFTNVQGFNRDNFDGDVMLVVTELAEAIEGHRKQAADEHLPSFRSWEVELADALVRIFHLGGKYNLRLGPAFVEKLLFNLSRPPKHGKEY